MIPVNAPSIGCPDSLSPSQALTVGLCNLRLAWDAGDNGSFVPPSAAAVIGTISHDLVERAAKGELDGMGIAQIVEKWDQLVQSEEEKLKTAGGMSLRIIPLAESHRQFGRIRLAGCKLAAEARTWPRFDGNEGDLRRHGPELKISLETPGGIRVSGKLDWVGVDKERLVIRDQKSGEICDDQGDIKEEYRSQLLVYAWLYNKMFGVWADRLELIPLGGTPMEVHYTQEEALQYVDERLRSLQESSTAIESSNENPQALASPSTSACRYCRWRAHCDAYWKADDVRIEGDFEGELIEVAEGAFKTKICFFKTATAPLACLSNVTEAIWAEPELDIRRYLRISGGIRNKSSEGQYRASASLVVTPVSPTENLV